LATTSTELARTALRELELAGVAFAVLHGEERVARGEPTSDVDLVVDRPAPEVVARTAAAWAGSGLVAVMMLPYDVGCCAVFLTDSTASEGVQLDLMHDPEGRSRLRVRSTQLLAHAEPGVSFPRVRRLEAATYLLQKRSWKQQHLEADQLRAELATLGGPAGILSTGDPFRWVQRAAWFGDRVLHPVGSWVDVPAPLAAAVAERFGRFLVRAVVVRRHRDAWLVPRLLLRPSLVVTSGVPVGPHARVACSHLDETCEAVVAHLARRVNERLEREAR
jgi:hypothetical protein